MPLVVPDSAESFILDLIVNSADRILKLFTNPLNPGDTTTLGDITQATGSGYNPITLTSEDWTIATVNSITTATFAEQTFTFNAAVAIYGYYVTTTGGNLLWVERFTGAPFQLPNGGGQISIITKLSLD